MPLKRTKRRTVTEETYLTVTADALIALLKRTGEINDSDNVDDIFIQVPNEKRHLSLIDGGLAGRGRSTRTQREGRNSTLTLAEAYTLLGLTDLDDYLENTVGDREIGATLWMCVEGVLNMGKGRSTVFAAETFAVAETALNRAVAIAEALGFVQAYPTVLSRVEHRDYHSVYHNVFFHAPVDDKWHRSQPPCLAFTAVPPETVRVGAATDIAAATGRPCDYYLDSDWKQRTLARRAGPFAAVRVIKVLPGLKTHLRYFGFDSSGTYLLELTEAGARELMSENESVRWQRIRMPAPEAMDSYGKDTFSALQTIYGKLGIPPMLLHRVATT